MTGREHIVELLKDRAFLFAITALALILGLAYWDWRQFENAAEGVQETQQSLLRIEHILSTMKDAETGQRGFLIAGEDNFLEPYNTARTEIAGELASIRSSSFALTPVGSTLGVLQQTIDAKLVEMQRLIDLRRTEGEEPAFAQLKEGSGKRLMDEIRIYCAHIEDSLRAQLDTRNRLAESQTRQARLISAGASCILFILVALATL